MSSVTQTVFHPKPQVLYVDEDYSVKAPPYATIDKLIQSLQENGPLVAVGNMGPSAYREESFKLRDQVANQDIYGWKPGTYKDQGDRKAVIILGANKTENKSLVYYTLAKDITRDERSLIRGYRPSETDGKVYVMSYENFLERSLVDLHPICPYGQWLYSVDAKSILADKETRKKCHEIGQKIFDHYKAAARGDTGAGRDALVRICGAAKVLTPDGVVRKSHIESAWDGVGDRNWQLQS